MRGSVVECGTAAFRQVRNRGLITKALVTSAKSWRNYLWPNRVRSIGRPLILVGLGISSANDLHQHVLQGEGLIHIARD